MIIEQRRKWWWAYLALDEPIVSQLLYEFQKEVKPKPVMDWCRQNFKGNWRVTNEAVNRKGDDSDYIAFRFSDESDSMIFQMRYQGWVDEDE